MLTAVLLTAALATAQPADVFAGLTGSCYRADIPDGTTDTHCFSVGGKAVMDIHKVRKGDDVVYEGVTIYRDAGNPGVLAYAYYNSLGDLLPGFAYRTGDDIHFPETADVNATPQLTWHIAGDTYDVMIAGKLARHFNKLGPTGDSGF